MRQTYSVHSSQKHLQPGPLQCRELQSLLEWVSHLHRSVHSFHCLLTVHLILSSHRKASVPCTWQQSMARWRWPVSSCTRERHLMQLERWEQSPLCLCLLRSSSLSCNCFKCCNSSVILGWILQIFSKDLMLWCEIRLIKCVNYTRKHNGLFLVSLLLCGLLSTLAP